MKKLFFYLLMAFAISFSGCNKWSEVKLPTDDEQVQDESKDDDNDKPPLSGKARYLVLYASRSGNSERVAQLIQSTLDCDILEVQPAVAYESDYNDMLARAQQELQEIAQGNYPPIGTNVDDFESYDLIFIGYPIWYGHMATPMQAFLHSHAEKLQGKRIALFATSGSSGIATSLAEAQALCMESTFTQTLLLTSSTLTQMENHVAEWLSVIGAEKSNPNSDELKIKLSVGDRAVFATVVDNVTTRDLISRLPITITMTDYANAEKIYTFEPALNTEGVAVGHSTPVRGDIDLYLPWGNLCVLYRDVSGNSGLINLGHIDDDGIELFDVPGNIIVTIEKQ